MQMPAPVRGGLARVDKERCNFSPASANQADVLLRSMRSKGREGGEYGGRREHRKISAISIGQRHPNWNSLRPDLGNSPQNPQQELESYEHALFRRLLPCRAFIHTSVRFPTGCSTDDDRDSQLEVRRIPLPAICSCSFESSWTWKILR